MNVLIAFLIGIGSWVILNLVFDYFERAAKRRRFRKRNEI